MPWVAAARVVLPRLLAGAAEGAGARAAAGAASRTATSEGSGMSKMAQGVNNFKSMLPQDRSGGGHSGSTSEFLSAGTPPSGGIGDY